VHVAPMVAPWTACQNDRPHVVGASLGGRASVSIHGSRPFSNPEFWRMLPHASGAATAVAAPGSRVRVARAAVAMVLQARVYIVVEDERVC
jgi:hypothetical protein